MIKVNSFRVENKVINVKGKLIRIAVIKDEWDIDVEDPASLMEALKNSNFKADIFTFMQRLPETKPKYNYYMEWDNVAVISIKDYDYWWKKQIKKKIRENVRKAQRKGVIVKTVPFNDELVKGIMNIYNETPIRQGKHFNHYGKDFETVKREQSDRLGRADFIGAYYNNELIGFIKLINTDSYIRTSGTVSKVEHRNKSPMNALIAKAVETCDKNNIPYLVYGQYHYGKKGSDTLTDFKRHNGFEKIDLPRYYIPLTLKGSIILKLKLHHRFIEILPKKVIACLIYLRKNYYLRKYRNVRCV